MRLRSPKGSTSHIASAHLRGGPGCPQQFQAVDVSATEAGRAVPQIGGGLRVGVPRLVTPANIDGLAELTLANANFGALHHKSSA